MCRWILAGRWDLGCLPVRSFPSAPAALAPRRSLGCLSALEDLWGLDSLSIPEDPDCLSAPHSPLAQEVPSGLEVLSAPVAPWLQEDPLPSAR